MLQVAVRTESTDPRERRCSVDGDKFLGASIDEPLLHKSDCMSRHETILISDYRYIYKLT